MAYLKQILIRSSQFLRRFPRIYSLYYWLKLNSWERLIRSKGVARYQYRQLLRKLKRLIIESKFYGGTFTEKGEYYLRLPGDILAFYNIDNPKYRYGDALSIVSNFLVDDDPIRDLIYLAMRGKKHYFDVGANNGYYYSLRVAKDFPKAQVIAFEPNPKVLYHFEKNIGINQLENLTLIPVALSSYSGIADLAFELGAGSFINPINKNTYATMEVNCESFDKYIQSNGCRGVDVVKIDVEGGEMGFLEGAYQSVSEYQPVLVLEFKEKYLNRSGSSQKDIIEYFKKINYSMFQIQKGGDVLCVPEKSRRFMALVKQELGHVHLTEIKS